MESSVLTALWSACCFLRTGYQPYILAEPGAAENLSIILRQNSSSLHKPRCPGRRNPSPLPEIRVQMPHFVRKTLMSDADFTRLTIYASRGKGSSRLDIWSGNVSLGVPGRDWLAGLAQVSASSIRCGEVDWLDFRGVTPHGLRSRWLGYFYSFATYSNAPPEAATRFDKMIDTGCCW